MKEYTLGIDVAKQSFDVALLAGDRPQHHTFANDSRGFAALDNWLTKGKASSLHACMEATGRYWEDLANHQNQDGHLVSVVNPAQVRAFGQSRLLRTKTDKSDAALIASFCRSSDPRPWTPPPAEQRELQELTRRLHSLKQMHLMESNRLKAGGNSPAVEASLQESLAFLAGQIKAIEQQMKAQVASHPNLKQGERLLTTIISFGSLTASRLLAEIGDINSYESARQLAAHAGLTPRHCQSGSSIHGKSRLSKVGNVHLRDALYMAAIVAMRYNPIIKEFAARLLAAGKPMKLVIAACMRKLLHIAFGVLKHQRPFDPNYQPCIS